MSVADLLGAPPTQDYIILGAFKSPGLATVRNGSSIRKWDVRDGYGQSGGSVVFTGSKIKRCEVDIYIWTPAHWNDWAAFSKILALPKPPISAGIGISHPVLNNDPIGFTTVVIEEVTPWVEDDEGGWMCTIKMIEFAKPKPALSKPIASIPATSPALPTAQDAADQEKAAKLATFNALAAGGK